MLVAAVEVQIPLTLRLLQVVQGVRNRGVGIRTAHPVTLLAEAYRRA